MNSKILTALKDFHKDIENIKWVQASTGGLHAATGAATLSLVIPEKF